MSLLNWSGDAYKISALIRDGPGDFLKLIFWINGRTISVVTCSGGPAVASSQGNSILSRY